MSDDHNAKFLEDLIDNFMPYCKDKGTLNKLKEMCTNRNKWNQGHHLFDRIRHKNLKVGSTDDPILKWQYSFEEIVAKTFYNLSEPMAPFDTDSLLWVYPIALNSLLKLVYRN